MNSTTLQDHQIVSRQEWMRLSREFLDKEKELTRQSDELARQRRELPWTAVEKTYVFDSPHGKLGLADLFNGRSQLAVYHFMFGPDWTEGCPGCSYVTDHINGTLEHLAARDVSLVLVSRGPLEKLTAFKQRRGWKLPWVSSGCWDFNFDFGVAFTPEQVASGANAYNFGTTPPHGEENPGLSFFHKASSGALFHTYSTFGRGLDALLGTYVILDRAPQGRDEANLTSPMSWVRHHDKYEPTLTSIESCCHN
ncbi:MAG: thioredoxin [Planctomycetaceae bacterium]|nr:thioredoxin [Planctomycetaceae bacterium]